MKYLYTPTVKRSATPVMLDSDQLSGRQGFRSVFGYPKETSKVIERQGNTRDLGHLPVYCDVLFVDFDDNLTAAEHYGEQLKECGIAYEKYDSGNRSIHYHVPVTPCVGNWVPRSAYEYAHKYANGCDLSIYRHTGLFRLPGTWHEKNPGHFKRRLTASPGRSLTLEPPKQHTVKRAADDDGVPLAIILARKVDSGGRRCYVYTIGSVCCKRDIPKDRALELALQWNNNCALPPLDSEIVWTKIEEAYK